MALRFRSRFKFTVGNDVGTPTATHRVRKKHTTFIEHPTRMKLHAVAFGLASPEEERGGSVFEASSEEAPLDVLTPIRHAIPLAYFHLIRS